MSQGPEHNLKRKRESENHEKRIKIVVDDLPAHINYWLNEATPDCYFKVGPESGPIERIGALKVFLAAHSEPLRAMFGMNCKEQEKSEARVIDVDPDTFKTLLKCICGGSDIVIPKLTFEESAKLLQVTDKYLVDDVKNKVVRNLGELLTCQNVFTALSYPICLQDENVNLSISKIVRRHTKEILLDKQFMGLSKDAVLWILQQKDLNAKEIDIWNAVLKWAKRKVNSSDGKIIRSYIYSLLNHIRFLTMDVKELWKYVVPSKVLLVVEIHEICKSLITGMPHDMNYICRTMCPRQICNLSDKIVIIPMTFTKYADVFCSINNCTALKWKEDSESFFWSRFHWTIAAGRRNDVGYETFGLFVSCQGVVEKYTCPFKATATLISEDGCRRNSRSFSGNFSEKVTMIGNSNFCSWETMNRTFIRNDKVKVMVHIQLF